MPVVADMASLIIIHSWHVIFPSPAGMMAPDAPEPSCPCPPEGPTAGPVGASADQAGVAPARAPLRWPYTSRRAMEAADQRAAATVLNEESSDSGMESDDASSQSSAGREQAENIDSDQDESSDDSCAAVLSSNQPEHDEPLKEPDPTLTAESVAVRADKMFVVGSSEVVASDMPRLAPEPTKRLVQLAAAHLEAMTKARVAALSQSFGNFDRTVGLGWLIADAVGRPVMERKAAHASGLKAARAAGNIKAEVRAAKLRLQRAACKLAADDPQREELTKQVSEAEAAILRERIDVALLPAPLFAPAVASRASGSRKRAREAELSHNQLIAAAEGRLLKAEREVMRTEARKARAEAAQEVAWQKLERVSCKYDGRDDVTAEQHFSNLTATSDAQFAWMLAVRNMKDAENEVSLAMLEESEAEKELNQLEWNECVRALDSLTEKHSKLVDAYAELARDYRKVVEGA